MAARGTGSSPGRDRGSGSALLAHAGWRSAAVLGLATLLLLAVAIGTRGGPGGAIPVPAAPAVWQTATYALVGIVIGITIAGLPIALVARRRTGSGRPRLGFWQRMVATLSPILLLAVLVAWWSRHPLTVGAGSSSGSGHRPGPASSGVLQPVTAPPQAAPTTVLLVALVVGIAVALVAMGVLVIRFRAASARPPMSCRTGRRRGSRPSTRPSTPSARRRILAARSSPPTRPWSGCSARRDHRAAPPMRPPSTWSGAWCCWAPVAPPPGGSSSSSSALASAFRRSTNRAAGRLDALAAVRRDLEPA